MVQRATLVKGSDAASALVVTTLNARQTVAS